MTRQLLLLRHLQVLSCSHLSFDRTSNSLPPDHLTDAEKKAKKKAKKAAAAQKAHEDVKKGDSGCGRAHTHDR